MSEGKWGFFPFDAMDYKAAQAYLDKKAAQGWVLDKLRLNYFARFVPAEGRCHYVDLDLPRVMDDKPDDDYLQLCADAGWELAARIRNMLLFRSGPGRRPVPLQTDEEMEAERFWKKYVRRNFLFLLFLLLVLVPVYILLLSLRSDMAVISELLCTSSVLLLPPLLLFAVFYLLWSLCRILHIYLRFRRRGAIPRQGRGAWLVGALGYVMGALLVVWWVLYMAEGFYLGKTVDVAWTHFGDEYTATPELCQSYPVITAADLGLEYSEDSRYLDGRRALLVDHLDYSEITDGEAGASHILTTERYECLNETVARWMFSARRWETASGQFLWGELAWGAVRAEGDIDQMCTARDGSYLLARKGNIVILSGASGLDLTAHLETIRDRGF